MYNVKILKYPAGWQIRVYSRPVGFCWQEDKSDNELSVALCYDTDIGDFVPEYYNPDKKCLEPFTGGLGNIMVDKQVDKERSVNNSMHRTVNRIYHLSRSNIWDWFFTLTLNPDKVDSFDYPSCVKALKSWLDSARRVCPDMQYIIVPERHKSGRYHFHGLFARCDGMQFELSGHTTKDGQPIYNIGRYRLGWSTATQVKDNERATKYICKYITKELCMVAFGKKRYWASRNLSECDTEEFIVEGSELSAYVDQIEQKCKHKKVIEMSDLTTTYYEMGVDIP